MKRILTTYQPINKIITTCQECNNSTVQKNLKTIQCGLKKNIYININDEYIPDNCPLPVYNEEK